MTSKKKTTTITEAVNQGKIDTIFNKFNLADSYTSLLLGIVVVVLVSFLFLSYIHNTRIKRAMQQDISSQKTEAIKENKKVTIIKEYIIMPGDTIKSISQKFYKTEDYYLMIVTENGITNPDIIEVGQKIKIPVLPSNTTVISPTNSKDISANQTTIGDTYVIKDGDQLFDIAQRAYGDGYRWPEIAKANNLTNPDNVLPGTKLIIPR